MINERIAQTLERWHEFVAAPDAAILEEILAAEMQFHSPFLWKPKDRNFALTILPTAAQIFENFRYTRKMYSETSATLEFAAEIGTISLQGVDLIEFDNNGKITDFKVMIRPAKGLETLAAEIGKRLMMKSE